MKITFIGTSHGVPAENRYCSCAMIESGKAIYFIDAGAPVIDCMLRLGKRVKDMRAIFTSHVHSDHTVGMIHIAALLNWYYKDCSADFYVTEQAHIDATKNWLVTSASGDVDESRIRFKIPTEGLVYEDENIKVEYIATKHMPNSYAILVTEGDKRILFSGDLSGKLRGADIPALIEEDIDAFVSEMAHFGMAEIKPYLEKCRAKRVIFTHVFPLKKYEDIEAAKGKYPFEIIDAFDGQVLEL